MTPDFDQGGTYRTFVKKYMGPAVGWIYVPQINIFPITAAGTYQLTQDVTLVLVNVAGSVTVILPTSLLPRGVPAGAQIGAQTYQPITVVDIGGNAFSHPITIKPATVAESIMNLNSIQIQIAYGAFTILPQMIVPFTGPASNLLLEDGVSNLQLEDGVSDLELE